MGSELVKTCHVYQTVGNANPNVKTAPLKPLPAFDELFSRLIIDCVSSMPKTNPENNYLYTIMCTSAIFPFL